MKNFIFLMSLSLMGCVSSYHSWLVKDNMTNTCYAVYSSPLSGGERASWTNMAGKEVRTSSDYDVTVVHNENYEAAAHELHVDLNDCVNGLN